MLQYDFFLTFPNILQVVQETCARLRKVVLGGPQGKGCLPHDEHVQGRRLWNASWRRMGHQGEPKRRY